MKKPVLIAQNCPDETAGTILDWLEQRSVAYRVIHTYAGDAFLDPKEVEAVICLGCPHSVVRFYDYDYLKRLHGFVTDIVRENRPYLGICFGGQLLASVLGARVEAGKCREIGTFDIALTDNGAAEPVLRGFPAEFPAFHWHSDTFRTPFGASHLASDENWKHQAFRKDQQIGIQFHIETPAEEVPRWCEIYADELASAGRTADDVDAEYRAVANRIRELNFMLLDNWLG